ncbi:hypothetical protein EVAR_91663_1 [Eumeta japonica]|uniref:Uncharacterized protein n=1 Tax=Eumeta variegata TaxID=151549 RepID=A0A4C1Z2G7_EUMVA|nr:hypothetical protein EVAR_91663_1 [Eumeta japonica]
MGRYSADKGRVLLAAGASAAQNRIHMADGLSVGVRLTTHLSGSFNPTCRSKLLRRSCWLERAGARLQWHPFRAPRAALASSSGTPAVGSSTALRRTRKAAILILDSDVDVEEDQTLIDENVLLL